MPFSDRKDIHSYQGEDLVWVTWYINWTLNRACLIRRDILVTLHGAGGKGTQSGRYFSFERSLHEYSTFRELLVFESMIYLVQSRPFRL